MSDDFAAGLRRAAEIAKGKAWPVGLTMHPHLHGPVAAGQHDMAIEIADAILAAIPAPAPWTPPEDRQDGYSCLIWVHGGWEKGTWWRAVRQWRSGGDFYDAPTHFAPLPPAPAKEDAK